VLGTVTLANVDQLAAMSADEIERVADQVIEAAHDTANVLREAARRVRHSGLVANERLANFVRVASTCTDAARLMSASVEQRDEPQPEPEPPAAVAAEPDLDALEAEVNGDRAGAT
jgi:hypothetical protein